MKIAHVISTYPPYRGGMGEVAENMVRQLKKRGHDVLVFTPAYKDSDLSQDGPEVHRLKPVFTYGNSAFVPNLYKLLKGIDVIHLHYPFFGGAEAVASFKQHHPEIPLIMTYHMDVKGSGVLGWMYRLYGKLYFPWIANQADHILVSSMDYARDSNLLKEKHFEKIIELPFGVSRDFQPVSRIPYPISSKLRLLFVSALDKSHYFKGLDLLLEAIKELDANKFELHIIGDGELRKYYESLAGESVIFRGKLNREELIQAYQEADLTLKPSIDRSEAFGLTLIESMACGTPVLATDLPGVRTVFDEKTGFLVPPGDKLALQRMLEKIINDPTRLGSMRRACVDRVDANYRWKGVVDKLVSAYSTPPDLPLAGEAN